jgi:MtrB/PioB family decaheme-associated outer membrane protein
MNKRSTTLSLAVATVLLAAGAAQAQETAAPDTSAWACKKCPFPATGYDSTVELGAGYLDESSAKFGDYTGLDKDGAYVVANAEGKATYESGYEISYDMRDLGLDSREVRLDGGKQGSYDFSLFYDRVPHRIADTAETVFGGIGSTNQTLPSGWVTAGSTGGMTALDSSLRSPDVGYDRDRYGAAGRYFLGSNWGFTLDYRRDDRNGTRPTYGSFGSVTSQLLRPIDDATDRLNLSARYEGSRWFAQVGYYGSIYDNKASALRWENPFNSFVPAATTGQMALEPDNSYNEIAVSAGMHGLPGYTVIAFSAATGEGSQDVSFLPYTITPGLTTDALPMSNLDGKVKVNRADLTVTSRPIDRLRLRGSVAWDERSNDSKQAAFTSIVHTDLFPVSVDRINPAYGYDRLRVLASADYDFYPDLTVGAGGEYRKLDRKGTEQEVRSEDTVDGFVRVNYRPSGYLGFVVKGGFNERNLGNKYDTSVAAGYGQNPLLRKYELAYRFERYGDLLANLAVGTLPLTLSANVHYGDINYSETDLGLQSGLNRRYGVDLTWAVNDKASAYGSVGREKLSAGTRGSSDFSDPNWRSDQQDDFQTYGAGVRYQFAPDLALNLDYTYAKGDSDTNVVGLGGGKFPTVRSQLDTFKADFTYGLSKRTDIVFTWWHEKLSTDDWAVQGIGPATLPTVLALGIDPYNYSVNYVTASVRYYFGPRGEDAAE